MFSIVIIAAGCALAIGHDTGAEQLSSPWLRLAIVPGCVIVHCLTAWIIAVGCGDTTAGVRPISIRRIELFERLHVAIWVGLALFLVLVVDWPTFVRNHWGLRNYFLIDELVISLPLVLPWLVSWAILFDISANEPRGNKSDRLGARYGYVLQRARIVLGLGIAPVLLVCGFADVVNYWDPRLLKGDHAAAFYMAPLVCLVVFYPWLLRVLWRTHRMPEGRLLQQMRDMARRERVLVNGFLVWQTGRGISNAAITGIVPGFRYVFLTDGLLEDLNDDEILAVFAHELGHARNQHILKRTLALLLPATAAISLSWVTQLVAPSTGSFESLTPISLTPISNCLTSTGFLIGLFGYMLIGLGLYSRMLEREADMWACRTLHRSWRDDATVRYLAVLEKMTRHLPNQGEGWLHPGWQTRSESVRRMMDDSNVELAFTRRLAAFGTFTAVMAGTAFLALLATFLR